MAVRKATAVWQGDLRDGTGQVESESGALKGSYGFGSRFQEEKAPGTNPEELIAAAHASCFAMALSNTLAQAGHVPDSVRVEGAIHLEKGDDGFAITRVNLSCDARVPGIDEAVFQEKVQEAKVGCPVSGALAAIEIEVTARLES
jgi:lipoyl-dependent peroxiredoxin